MPIPSLFRVQPGLSFPSRQLYLFNKSRALHMPVIYSRFHERLFPLSTVDVDAGSMSADCLQFLFFPGLSS